MSPAQINAWVRQHDIKILRGQGGVGMALDWDDFPSANNRRHLTIVSHDLTLEGAEKQVRTFCALHKLPLP